MIIGVLTGLLIFVTILMIVCIFMQRPEGNSFTSGASDTLANILSAQSSRNPVARLTGILAVLFFVLCLTIATLTSHSTGSSNIVSLTADKPQPAAEAAPVKKQEADAKSEKTQSTEKSDPVKSSE